MSVNTVVEKVKAQLFKPNGNEKSIYKKTAQVPAVNIVETMDYYLLTIAAPGFKKEDFEIIINNQTIIISAIKQTGTPECVKDRCEYDHTKWSRPFILPADADAILANAIYRDGELIIRIPKGAGDILIKEQLSVYVY